MGTQIDNAIKQARGFLFEQFTPFVVENAVEPGKLWKDRCHVSSSFVPMVESLLEFKFLLVATIPNDRKYAINLLKAKVEDYIRVWGNSEVQHGLPSSKTRTSMRLESYKVNHDPHRVKVDLSVAVIFHIDSQKGGETMTFGEKLKMRENITREIISNLQCGRSRWKEIDDIDTFVNNHWADKLPKFMEKCNSMIEYVEKAQKLRKKLEDLENS